MKVIVTGGAGLIGSHLVDKLLENGHQVLVVDNLLTGQSINLAHCTGNDNFELANIDISDSAAVANLSGPFDWIFNLASPASPVAYGNFPIKTLLANSAGTFNMLELAKRDEARFLQASTSEVYGDPMVHPQTEDYWGNVNPVGPRSCYDEGKRFGESLVMEFVRQFDLDARIARIFNTYGPRSRPDDGRVVPSFCIQALNGEPISIFGTGMQSRSFCYVADTVDGLYRLMATSNLRGEIINIGNPSEVTIREFAELVIELSGSGSTIDFHPLPVDDPTRRQPDISKARQLLGWEPHTTLRAGLEQTLESFRATV